MRKEKLIRLSSQRIVLKRPALGREDKDKINGVFFNRAGNVTGYSQIVRIESAENFLERLQRNILNGLNVIGIRV